MLKWVYNFGAGRADGSAAERDNLGGKGACLAEMSRLGLPVPPGFTISAEVCAVYYQRGRKLPDELKPMVGAALAKMEEMIGFQKTVQPGFENAHSKTAMKGELEAPHGIMVDQSGVSYQKE